MPTEYGFIAKKVYPSQEGLHFEHYTEEEALLSYEDARKKGKNVALNGLIMTWYFPVKSKNYSSVNPPAAR